MMLNRQFSPKQQFSILGALVVATCLMISMGMSCLGQTPESERREWSDRSGKFRITATLQNVSDDKIELLKEDGKTISVPLNRLSDSDLAFIKNIQDSAVASKPSNVAERMVSSGDWPQWRGPRRDGISDEQGLLKTWSTGGPPIAWQTSGLGGGFSSLAIAGDKIFTLGKFGSETKLVALPRDGGEPLWATVIGQGDNPNGTPSIDDNHVYSITHGGDLSCVMADTGELVWSKNFERDFGGRMMSSWGFSESPLVDGDRLIVTPGGNDAMMVALDKATGELIWKASMPAERGSAGLDGAGYSSIVISKAAKTKQYVQLVGKGVIGVDAETGKFLWGYNRVANTTANVPSPIVVDDFVLCSSGYDDGGTALLKIVGSRGGIACQEVWYKNNRKLQNHHGGMIYHNGFVYMGHGHNNGFPICFDLKTGNDRWRPGRGAGTGSAAVTMADGHLYFRYEDGTMALIEAEPGKYALTGKFRIAINNGQSWSHPVVNQGRLYLRDQDELIVYDVQD